MINYICCFSFMLLFFLKFDWLSVHYRICTFNDKDTLSHCLDLSSSSKKCNVSVPWVGLCCISSESIVWHVTIDMQVMMSVLIYSKLPFRFSSVAQSCQTLCDPMDCSTPGFPVYHQLLEPTQTHIHWVGDAIWPSHSLSSPSPPTFNFFQHQGLFQLVISSHQVAKVLEFKLQHQSFQWIFRTDFL